MPVSRRQIVAAIPAAALAASLPRTPARAQDGRKVVTFWFAQANSDGQAALRSNLIDAFNASQDKYTLQLEVKGAAVNNLLKVALLAGNGPDIVQTSGPSYLTSIANAGQLLPLDDLAAKFKWKERFLPALLNTGVYGDKLYALPRDYESMHLFYNKQVFSQNGWKLPTNRAEFEAVADAALAKGITPFSAGNADWKGVNEWLMTVFFNNVAGPDNVHKALGGELPWTAPPFAEAVELSKAWYTKGYFGKNYLSLTNEQSFLQVVNGKAAMAFNGTWSFGTKSYGMSKPDTVMDVAPIPGLSDRVTTPLAHLACGATLSIAKNSQNADGAAAVFEFMLSRKFYENMNRDWPGKWALPVKDLPPDLLQGIGYPLFEKTIVSLHEAFSSGRFGYTTWTFWPNASNSYVTEGIEQVWLNRITTDAFLNRLQTVFAQEFREGKVPPLPPRAA
ncbi:MAG: raffinose/stachyose/melibiose transport system substrate-binding protein [Bradyrhizobium sp.]|jgi:raffinose/stachyose/melibiose transport system substrate-binding protein